ncbi:MAG: aromatic aminobenezylarsenical efflux permease ArsG family transporter [Bacteroidota bacterium]|nr:aromatic aminobenezylarsenical efflux permease ArsG family transporter [Bacteroidota bacterium]
MDFLNSLLENSTMPWLSALTLGLMTAISPCPLATNITAVGFISKDLQNRNRVFINGLFYTLGRAISYWGIAIIIYLGANQFRFSGFLQQYGERLLGPLLIVIGLFMLGVFRIAFPALQNLQARMEQKKRWNYYDALLLGMIFALAFCPYSGVLYFGMLIPMTIANSSGLYLPVVFAIATGIPVILFSWVLAYAVSGLSRFYDKVKVFEIWFRRVIAILFMIVGFYSIIRGYL